MNLGRRRPTDLEINLAPLIDVVFLLLIFFMVSTTFEKETQIEVELPKAESESTAEEPPEKLELIIDQTGRFFVNDEEVTNSDPAALKAAIEIAAKGNTELPVMIKADGQAPYQAVVTGMDVLSQLGLTRMSFVASRQKTEE